MTAKAKPDTKVILPIQMTTKLKAAALKKSKETGIKVSFIARTAIEKWVKGETQSEKSDT